MTDRQWTDMLELWCAGILNLNIPENYAPELKTIDVSDFFIHKIAHWKFWYVPVHTNVCTGRGKIICAYQAYKLLKENQIQIKPCSGYQYSMFYQIISKT